MVMKEQIPYYSKDVRAHLVFLVTCNILSAPYEYPISTLPFDRHFSLEADPYGAD
jgi:hypothetical protein